MKAMLISLSVLMYLDTLLRDKSSNRLSGQAVKMKIKNKMQMKM